MPDLKRCMLMGLAFQLKIDYDILSEGYEIAKKISARSNRKK